MAANAIKYPLGRFSKRGLTVQPLPKSSQAAPDINCTVLPNKLMVSSLDLCGPLSRVTIAFKVGPRNETFKNLGVTHVIRAMTGLSTRKCTGFGLMRNLQQNGIHLTCTGDREVTAFNVVAARSNIVYALKYLAAVTTCPNFKHWQILDNQSRWKYEINGLTPEAKLMEMLHTVSYRTGLGNSLFVKPDHIGIHTSEMLHTFFYEGFTANRGAVVGYNIDHRDMLDFSKCLELENNEPPLGNSKYYGGEVRENKRSYFARVAIAAEGVGYKDVKECLVYSVLQHAYGIRPSIVWGASPSPIYKATYPVAPDAGVSCFNINYSDSGLFGFIVSSSAETAGKAVTAGMKILKSAMVSEADVKRAKAMLKMNILSNSENTENLVEDMAVQSLHGGVVIPPPVLAEAVDKITVSDVSAAAKKIASGKFSMAALGCLNDVPFLDELL